MRVSQCLQQTRWSVMGLTPGIVGTDSPLTKLLSLVVNSDRFKLSGAGTLSPEESEVSLHLFSYPFFP